MAYKTGNPTLNQKTFDGITADPVDPMTLDGVAGKSLILLLLCILSGAFGWRLAAENYQYIWPLVIGALVVALIIAFITVVKMPLAPKTAPLYALFEGFALGAISQLFNAQYDGIVVQALLLTGGIFFAMLMIYRLRLIQATKNFQLAVAAATFGVFLYYLANFALSFFGIDLPLINSNSNFGIAFTAAVVILAALNLVMDFDFIEVGVEKKAPKYMEWYAGFGLLVTIVWLYIELLRLLSKIRSR
jgi:uncharacterized YccA/Bax inhibitor family protein